MSSECAIRVNNLSKSFPIYDKPYHRLLQMVAPGPKQRWFREFQALKGVDLSVARGETLGIVGRNGSGKSTLLQLICGTLTPTSGTVEVQGRIAALLELGSGFNPDFTGRENVYLNGAVLGLTQEEIRERFDEIAEFAEIGEFIEQPVKSYSSGMYVRLAFAVAINVDPEILIVDEALSVGDEAFQRKCFARINKIRDAGATVLFVSHSAGAVTELCDRALLLDHGELLLQGAPKFVVSRYHKMLYAPAERVAAIRESIRNHEDESPYSLSAAHSSDGDARIEAVPGGATVADDDSEAYLDEGLVPKSTLSYEDLGAVIEDAHIETLGGRRVNVLKSGNRYTYVYNVRFHVAAEAVRFGMLIKSVTGLELGGGQSATLEDTLPLVEGGSVLTVRFQFRCLMAPGAYFLNAGVLGRVGDGEVYLNRQIDVAMFRVMPDPQRLATAMVDFEISPSVEF
ncbi:ABC transporter ATP-binding protein [Dyella jiangningensis]|uniref:ABC transporter ATP-binding protein n=1 Tax=Dyella jiangningensis TaxID=1379159 RepID=A0A328P6Q4_9GAMM|nr:ABC transporter ATP-binding protein [Dyella jiangningensis]RAO76971.1 ABC transporter ATP-binding protein [Dyella jiangningensis]